MWRMWVALSVLIPVVACGGGGVPDGEPFAQLEGDFLQPNGEFLAPCNRARFDEIGVARVSYFNSEAVAATDYDISFPDADAGPRDPYVNVTVRSFNFAELVFEVSYEATVFTYETVAIDVEFEDGRNFAFQFVVRNECPPTGSDVITQVTVPPTLRSTCSLITRTGPGEDVTGSTGVVWECDPPLAQVAHVANPTVFFNSADIGFTIDQLRRTADRTQGAFLSINQILVQDQIFSFAPDLFHLDLATGDIRRLTRYREEGLGIAEFVWSRDGTRILIRAVDFGTGAGKFEILEVATGALTEVATFDPVTTGLGLTGPAWSPDGNKIAYARQGHLHVIDLAAETDTRILENVNANRPNWHPTEDKIVFAAIGGALRIVDSTGADIQTGASGGPDVPEWSWDGKLIVYAADNVVAIWDPANDTTTELPDSEGPKYHDW